MRKPLLTSTSPPVDTARNCRTEVLARRLGHTPTARRATRAAGRRRPTPDRRHPTTAPRPTAPRPTAPPTDGHRPTAAPADHGVRRWRPDQPATTAPRPPARPAPPQHGGGRLVHTRARCPRPVSHPWGTLTAHRPEEPCDRACRAVRLGRDAVRPRARRPARDVARCRPGARTRRPGAGRRLPAGGGGPLVARGDGARRPQRHDGGAGALGRVRHPSGRGRSARGLPRRVGA